MQARADGSSREGSQHTEIDFRMGDDMNDFLSQLKGKKVDVSCGTSATVRGEVLDVKDGILYLRDEEQRTAYVAIEKIAFVWELDEDEHKAGFVL